MSAKTIVILALLWWVVPGRAAAQRDAHQGAEAATNAALAEATFQEGRAALQRGDNERACSLLAASNDLDRALGTTLALAHCYEVTGRTASAWTLFLEAEAWARRVGDDSRAGIAQLRVAALGPQLTRAVFSLPEGPHRPTSLRIDGNAVEPAVWGVEFPIDPGRHRIEAAAEGHLSWREELAIVASSKRVSIVIPELQPVATPAPKPTVPAAAPPRISPRSEREPSVWPTVLGATGVAALGTSGVFSWLAWRADRSSDAHCRTRTLCDERGIELRDRAFGQAAWATGVGAAGLVLTGVAGYLWFTEGGEQPVIAVGLTATDAQLALSGRF